MKYLVNIEEVLTRDIIIEAESEADAEYEVGKLYRQGRIVLDYSDFIGEPTIKCTRKCDKTEECTEIE